MSSQQTIGSGVDLAGQVAVVTGGGRGIGRAIALALAGAGARVAVVSRSQAEVAKTVELIEEAGGEAEGYVADVTDATGVREALTKAEWSLGAVELLVNNAAQGGPIGPFVETDAEEWWRTMEVNLRGAVLCCRSMLPGMMGRGRGRIVNVVSAAIPIPYFSSYATSKTALVRFTETIAAEMRPRGISLFALGPGTVRTAMSERSLHSPEGQKWLPWFRRIFDEGLDVSAERPARMVVELASGRADELSGRFVTIWDDLGALHDAIAEIEAENLYCLRVRKLVESGAVSPLSSIHAEAIQGVGDGGAGLRETKNPRV
jgi:NAD(P)-dependent dehydrogenase (short-subunit alcohol dehydrogenase family)